MGFLRGKKKDEEVLPEVPRQYIDLGKKNFEGRSAANKDTIWVKKVHIDGFHEVRELVNLIYHNNILLLDTKKIDGDSPELKRITGELKEAAKEMSGDVAVIDHGLIMVTPGPIKIERTKK